MPLHFINREVLLPTLIVAVMLSIAVALLSRGQRCRRVTLVWIATCVFLMLFYTVIGRTPKDGLDVHLMPFWSVGAIRDGYVETLYEKCYNVLFFIPLGGLCGFFFKERTVLFSMISGVATSVIIELLQLITRTGTCETDDVICNALGCLMGVLIALGMLGLYKWIKRRR